MQEPPRKDPESPSLNSREAASSVTAAAAAAAASLDRLRALRREAAPKLQKLAQRAGVGAGAVDERRQRIEKAKAKARRLDAIDHLGPEAVVAFVDEEMPQKSMHRVRVHMVHCPECRAEVQRQRGASEWVRRSNIDSQVRAPQDLLARLNGIAQRMADVAQDSALADAARTPSAEPRAAAADSSRDFLQEQDFLDKLEMVYRALRKPR